MRLDRIGQGNTFWVIIGAVLALVVLIVIIVIFTGKTSDTAGGLLDCISKGGNCVMASGDDCEAACKERNASYTSVFTCPEEKGPCCCLGAK